MSELQIGDRVQTGEKSVKMSELQIADRLQTGKISEKCLNYRQVTECKQVRYLENV